MNIESAIYNLLTTDSSLSAIVGVKVYPDTAPQNTANPCIVFQERDIEPYDTKSGASRLDVIYLSVMAYHNEQRKAKDISRLVRHALDRYCGIIGDVNIQSIQFQNATSLYDYNSQSYMAYTDYKVRQIIN